MQGRIKYILLQMLVVLISPLSSFLISVRYYKYNVSQIFFIIAAVYLGCNMGFVYDLMRHYQDIGNLYVDRSLGEILDDPRVFILGPDYYHITIKYIVSRFTTSASVFAGVAALVYSSCFIFFYRQLSQFYKQKLALFSVMLLLCTVTIIEFWWYQGVRFWTGAFYFFGMYLKYVNTRKKRYFLLSFLAIYFHYSLITLICVSLVNFVLSFITPYVRYGLLAFSLFYKTLNVDFVPLLLKYIPWVRNNLSIAVTDEKIHNSWREHTAEFRANENLVYGYRLPFLMLAAYLVLLFFRLHGVKLDKQYKILFFFSLTLWTVANFGFGDITFYTRFLEGSVLMLYAYVFIVSVKNQERITHYRLVLFVFLFLPAIYAILTPLVQYRAHLMHPELFLGNFFMEWDGNGLKIDYAWKN